MLGLMGVVAGAAIAGPSLAKSSGTQRVEPIGLQLYTVRDLLAADTPGTLATIAAAGYAEVETAGYADLTAIQFAVALKDAGLSAPSAHVPLQLIESEPENLIEAAHTVGHRYLVLPWLNEQQRDSLEQYRHIAAVLNKFGEQCAAAGIQLAYHNHDFEFVPIAGTLPYDLLLNECDAELVKFEMDLFWAVKAGVDPTAYFKAGPGRYPLCHVKDMNSAGEMVAVGDGDINFAALFEAGEAGGLKHYFVEHDNPTDALASIRSSINAVRAIRF